MGRGVSILGEVSLIMLIVIKRKFPRIVLVSILWWLISVPSLGNNLLGDYEVPPNAKKVAQRRSNRAGGSRSNCENPLVKNSLSLLVPEEKVIHKTAKENPSLFFYSQFATNTPIEFTLVDPNVAEPLVEETLQIKKPGYHQITLPEEIKLEPNKTYLWHIGIHCSNDEENFWEVLGAAIEYTPISAGMKGELEKAESVVEKANIYLGNGIWYDALSLLKSKDNSVQVNNYVEKLLESVNIKNNLQGK